MEIVKVSCEQCGKVIDKDKAIKIASCYFNPPKNFYVCSEDCRTYFLNSFRM